MIHFLLRGYYCFLQRRQLTFNFAVIISDAIQTDKVFELFCFSQRIFDQSACLGIQLASYLFLKGIYYFVWIFSTCFKFSGLGSFIQFLIFYFVYRANALFFKIRNFVNSSILRTIYFAIFESHLINYCCLVWPQNCNTINRLVISQKKLLELLTFSHVTLTPVLYSKEVLL